MLLPPLPRPLLLLRLPLRARSEQGGDGARDGDRGGLKERRDRAPAHNILEMGQSGVRLPSPRCLRRARRTRRTSTEGVGAAATTTHRRAMLVADPFAGIPFWRVLALALAVPAVQAILTGINLNWLAVLVSPLHALCFLCILTIQAREQG